MDHLVERNDITFNNIRGDASKVEASNLASLLDYTRIAWGELLKTQRGTHSMMISLKIQVALYFRY